MPGFTVLIVGADFSRSLGVDANDRSRCECLYGDHEPRILGHNMSHEEVYLRGGIGYGASEGVPLRTHYVLRRPGRTCRLHLHSPEMLSGVDDEIVTVTVTVGLRYVEAQSGSLMYEGEFRYFASLLGVAGCAQLRLLFVEFLLL